MSQWLDSTTVFRLVEYSVFQVPAPSGRTHWAVAKGLFVGIETDPARDRADSIAVSSLFFSLVCQLISSNRAMQP